MTLELLALLSPVIALGIGLLVAMIKWPKVWLGTVILAWPIFLFDSGEGLSASELTLGGFVIGSVVLWCVMRIAKGATLIRWWGDFLLCLFLVLSVFNLGIALLNDVTVIEWLSEWSVLLLMLYYFPLRDIFGTDDRGVRQLVTLLAVAAIICAGLAAYHYMMRTGSGLVFAYQILASRSRLFGPVFVLGIIAGTTTLFHVRSRWHQLGLLVFVLVNAGGLIQSFTRSLWIPTGISLFILLAFLTWSQRVRYILATCALVAATYVVADTVAPKITAISLRIMKERVLSSTQLTGGDYSFETRLIEADAAEQYIRMYPLGGNGMHAQFLAWDPGVMFTRKKPFIHIGYVSAMFKYGIPLSIILFSFVVLFSLRSLRLAWVARKRNAMLPLYRSLAISAALFLPALYLTILTAGFFDQRYGNVLLAIFFAFVSIVASHCSANSPREPHSIPMNSTTTTI